MNDVINIPESLSIGDQHNWSYYSSSITKKHLGLNSFSGETYILPIRASRTFGKKPGAMFQSRNTNQGGQITTDNPDFDRYFDVYSNVPETARTILNQAVIDSILSYRKDNSQKICFSFIKNTAYVALSHHKSFFEPRIYRNIVNFDFLAQYYRDFQLVLGIANLLTSGVDVDK